MRKPFNLDVFRRKPVAALAVFFCLLLSPAAATAAKQQQESLPTPEELFPKIYEQTKKSKKEKDNVLLDYTYNRYSRTEKLTKKGAVKETTEELREIVLVEGKPFARLLEKNSRPLSPEEAREEKQREDKFRQKLLEAGKKKPRKKKKKKKNNDEITLNRELVSRFDWKVTGRELVNGRPAYVLTFKPKNKKLPVRRRIDRALNKAAGTIWIDTQDYEPARIEIRLLKPVKVWWGILGSIHRFQFQGEWIRTGNGDWVPTSENVHLRARVLFKKIHRRSVRRWSAHRKIARPRNVAGNP